jgi:hypothetical protein
MACSIFAHYFQRQLNDDVEFTVCPLCSMHPSTFAPCTLFPWFQRIERYLVEFLGALDPEFEVLFVTPCARCHLCHHYYMARRRVSCVTNYNIPKKRYFPENDAATYRRRCSIVHTYVNYSSGGIGSYCLMMEKPQQMPCRQKQAWRDL